ncbi:MAG TPA: HAD family hydrolase [Ilumatobacter sp.]|nr:HAD family hydrolase [Ilumatobacter sp.]
MTTSQTTLTRGMFDAVLFDAGGVLVLPDPTVLAPLLAPYGGATDVAAHRRAHYAAMAAKSAAAAGEMDWYAYDSTYVRLVGVTEPYVEHAAILLNGTRTALLWRWPIPETLAALQALAAVDVPMGVVSNAAGQVEAELARAGVCQVGPGAGTPMRVIVDSTVVGVAKPDPAIFDHALPFFDGIARERIAYVGDSVTMDVGGATAAGLHPVLVDPYDDHAGLEFGGRVVSRVAGVSDLTALW